MTEVDYELICAKCLLCPEHCQGCNYLRTDPYWHCNEELLKKDFKAKRVDKRS